MGAVWSGMLIDGIGGFKPLISNVNCANETKGIVASETTFAPIMMICTGKQPLFSLFLPGIVALCFCVFSAPAR